MKLRFFAGLLPLLALFSAVSVVTLPEDVRAEEAERPAVKRFAPDSVAGLAGAVVVEETPLLYTGQLYPNADRTTFDAQWSSLMTALTQELSQSGAGRADLVKLNFYVASDELGTQVRTALEREFRDKPKPAITFVSGRLPREGAGFALDGIAVLNSKPVSGESDAATVKRDGVSKRPDGGRQASRAMQPAGPRVYISGQAEAAPDMSEATRRTMQSLERTLQHLGLTLRDVVQIKSFLGPMTQVADAEREIARFFADQVVPPLVFVEWKSSLPIEIELIAAAPRAAESAPAIEYITPPGMTASPVFCRVTRVNAPETIFISGLYAPARIEPAREAEAIFTRLSELLDETGSDLRHMAKATYYCASEDASNRLNEVRPKLYDPERPPAASKAIVSGSGAVLRSITLDMIAVRKRPEIDK